MVAQISSSHPLRAKRPDAVRAADQTREAALDAALVNRFRNGNQEAFVRIVERYRERMRMVGYRLLKNHADAEEIAQDTFIRAHRGLATFRGESSLSVWLHRIALNLARNRYWYFHRRQHHTTQSFDCTLSRDTKATFGDLIPCGTPGPARGVATQEFTEIVSECMEKLDSDQREILSLRNIQERTYEEIADRLNLKVGTVKSRIGRARKALRLMLAAKCPEFDAQDSPYEWLPIARESIPPPSLSA